MPFWNNLKKLRPWALDQLAEDGPAPTSPVTPSFNGSDPLNPPRSVSPADNAPGGPPPLDAPDPRALQRKAVELAAQGGPRHPKHGKLRTVGEAMLGAFVGPDLATRLTDSDYADERDRYARNLESTTRAAALNRQLQADELAELEKKERIENLKSQQGAREGMADARADAAEEKKRQTRIAAAKFTKEMADSEYTPYEQPPAIEMPVPQTVPNLPPPGGVTRMEVPKPKNLVADPYQEGREWVPKPKRRTGFSYLPKEVADEMNVSGREVDGMIEVPNSVVAQANKPDPAAKQNENAWIATVNDPNSTPEEVKQAKANLELLNRQNLGRRPTTQIFNPGEVRQNLDEIAQGLANGEPIQLQRVTSLRSGERSYVMAAARRLNPRFNPADVDRKVKALDYWANGKGADSLQSFDTFLQHAAEAEDAAGKVWNTNRALFNKPLSWWKQNMTADPAFAQFMTAIEPVGKEFESFLLNGRALYSEDRATIGKLLNENLPFSVTVATLKQMAKTAQDRYVSMNQRHKNVVGADLPTPWSPAALDAAKRMGLNLGSGERQPEASGNGVQAPSTGMIRVRRKEDGKTGQIPAANFDPSKYDKL